MGITYENPLGDYTEVDPGSKVTPTSVRVSWSEMPRANSYDMYFDFGANHFGDFIHDFDHCMTGESDTGIGQQGTPNIWMISDNYGMGWYEEDANNYSFLAVVIQTSNTSETNRVRLIECDAGTIYETNSWILSMNTTYYFRVIKSGTSLYCDVYNSAATRNTGGPGDGNVATYSLTLQNNYTLRYLHLIGNQNISQSTTWTSGWTENFNIHEKGQELLSSEFLVTSFYIYDVIATPSSVQRSGSTTTELRCDWFDNADLAAGAYTCKFYVRSPNDTVYGPFSGSVTKEGTSEYNATYDWNPSDSDDLGKYDLKAVVSR